MFSLVQILMFLFLEMVIYNIFEIEIKNLQIEHHINKE